MKKKYFVRYYSSFGNIYSLAYTETKEQEEKALMDGWEQITRKRAFNLCALESMIHGLHIWPIMWCIPLDMMRIGRNC